ncbi:MAG: hypothetical protein HOP02_11840 [Methylococcaceae bacterium]|nr:hypothetical protein [Methylococcaceae bacterium]
MFQNITKKLTAIFFEKIPRCGLILCSVSLSACDLYRHGPSGFMGDLISGTPRKAAVIVVYAILLGVLVTIPLYFAKYFENPRTYKFYKLFWWGVSLIFGNLSLLLLNVDPHSGQYDAYILWLLILVMIILIPTLAPAAYQNKAKMSMINRWALSSIALILFIYILLGFVSGEFIK